MTKINAKEILFGLIKYNEILTQPKNMLLRYTTINH